MWPHIVEAMLQDFGFLSQFSLDPVVLLRFAISIRRRYNSTTAFHNCYHGLAALQVTYMLAVECDLSSTLESHEVLGMLIAAFCHDVDHPGVTNAFMTASNAHLALLYNDHAVLENHHMAVTWQVCWLSFSRCPFPACLDVVLDTCAHVVEAVFLQNPIPSTRPPLSSCCFAFYADPSLPWLRAVW